MFSNDVSPLSALATVAAALLFSCGSTDAAAANVLCGKGQFLDATTLACVECSVGTSQHLPSHSETLCHPASVCTVGEYLAGVDADRTGTCKPCPAHHHQDETAHSHTACHPQPTCRQNELLVGVSSKAKGRCEPSPPAVAQDAPRRHVASRDHARKGIRPHLLHIDLALARCVHLPHTYTLLHTIRACSCLCFVQLVCRTRRLY